MADGDKRLDAVPAAFVDDFIVMAQACFLGLSLVAIREDAGPCDGEAIAFAAMDQRKRYYTSTPELLRRYAEIVPDVDGQK